jgi:hypothetical protein
MEYIYALLINEVVKNFKGVAVPIKTNKQIFVFVLPPPPLNQPSYLAVSIAHRMSASVIP